MIFPERKNERKSDEKSVAPSQNKIDAVQLRFNRLAVMPRMNTINGKSLQHMQSEAIESLLKNSAGELDEYFSKAYGFDQDTV